MLVVAGVVASVAAGASGVARESLAWTLLFGAGVLLVLATGGVYRHRFAVNFLDDLRAILGATAIAALTVTFVRLLLFDDAAAAAQAVRGWLFAAGYLAAGRAGAKIAQARIRHAGEGEATMIVGAGRVGQQLATRLADSPGFGLVPVAFFDDDPLDLDPAVDLPVLGSAAGGSPGEGAAFLSGFEAAVEELGIGHVVVTFSMTSHETELELLDRCQELGVSVSLLPRLFEGIPDQTSFERVGGLPLVSVYPSDPHGWQFAAKYAVDRLLAVVMIILASPLLALSALGTLLTSGRPVLFHQTRVGLDGGEFTMLKFRTMRGQADEESAVAIHASLVDGLAPGGVEGVDRRTRFGIFLRKSGLDELPQLVNVLFGQMSLIGPRPERPELASMFEDRVRRYAGRQRVKSGITGWAQVHGLRGKTSLEHRVEYDNFYVQNWSPWLDLKILLLTPAALFRRDTE